MSTSGGIVCSKDGFGCTVLDDAGGATDHEIQVPGNLQDDRGAALAWLAEEASRLAQLNNLDRVALQKPGGGKFGASGERFEVEAAVQIGLHGPGVQCVRLNREQVRAALGVPKAKGAYETLLARDDVRARSNAVRRDQYLLAMAAQT
jgi:hypothetical protein